MVSGTGTAPLMVTEPPNETVWTLRTLPPQVGGDGEGGLADEAGGGDRGEGLAGAGVVIAMHRDAIGARKTLAGEGKAGSLAIAQGEVELIALGGL